MKFMPHQDDLVKQSLVKRQLKFHVNKSRQIGLTEICLRIIQYQCFHKYEGGRVMIIAGTREKTTKKVMGRLRQMFKPIDHTLEGKTSDLLIKLKNGTEIEGLPSNSEAIRGDTKIKAILIDEAAHFGIVDDSVVLDAVQPIVMTNKSDLFLVSTPRSQRGFFYDIAISENDFKKLQYDFTNAIGWIYSKEEMDKELQRTDIDVDQEYRCQYTSARNSIFGVIDDASTEDFEVEEY
jgi:late competence protein required for DNA uptake (superfamily II DNA/RNA helicase)